MQLERTIQKAHPVFMRVGPVILFPEPVLDCLCSCAVHGYIICGSDREQLRQKDLEADGHVRVFGENAPFLHGQDRKLTFQRCGF